MQPPFQQVALGKRYHDGDRKTMLITCRDIIWLLAEAYGLAFVGLLRVQVSLEVWNGSE